MARPGAGAKSSGLQRRLLLEAAWQQYLEGTEPRGVRDEILRTFARARAERPDPRRLGP